MYYFRSGFRLIYYKNVISAYAEIFSKSFYGKLVGNWLILALSNDFWRNTVFEFLVIEFLDLFVSLPTSYLGLPKISRFFPPPI